MTTTTPAVDLEPVEATWRHIPALDGLRAFAVIAVLLFHGGYLQGGFLGVDLFFALSGYLITSLLIRDADGVGVRLSTFWGRRFRRLLPAVFAMIAVVAAWSWLFGSAADLDGVRRDGPWAVVYLANWHFIAESQDYWASFTSPSMFDHLWSLAIEEQFYVLWPIAVLAIWRWSSRPQRTLVTACVVGIIASLTAMVLLFDPDNPTRVYMGTDTRAASLLVGALVATAPVRGYVHRLVAALGRRVDVLIGVLVVGVAAAWISIDGASSEVLYRGGLLAHSATCAVIVVLMASVTSGPFVTTFGWRPLAWIGMLSYGLYLWHWPVYVVLSPSRLGFDGLGLLVVRIAVSFLLAYASLRIVENPIRYRAAWARGRRGAIALVVSAAALLTFLFALPAPPVEIAAFDAGQLAGDVATDVDGSPDIDDAAPGDAVPEPSSPAGDVVTDDSVAEAPADGTDATPGEPDAGEASDDAVTPDAVTPVPPAPVALPAMSGVLWAGDSVAADTGPGVAAALGAAGVQTDISGAFPGLRVAAGDRDLHHVQQLPSKLQGASFDTVILQQSTWDEDVDDETYRAGLVELADVLETYGARLVVVTAPPTDDRSVNEKLARLGRVAGQLAATDDRVWFLDASAVWASPAVADDDGDGAPERKRDLVHVCPAGSARFGAWLVQTLDRQFEGLTPADPAVWAAAPWTTDPRYDEPVGSCAPV